MLHFLDIATTNMCVLYEKEVKFLNHLFLNCLSLHTYEINIGSVLGHSKWIRLAL